MPVTKDMVPVIVMTGASARVAEDIPANFKVGDKVRAKNVNPATHTRLPRYVRGKIGTIFMDHGVFVTPDTVAHGQGEHPQHVYNVVFSGDVLWGGNASEKNKVYIDLWDDYLEKVEA
ncbi:SH3-like domain-containing protein [Rhizobium sp.]|jgi:nitrile hydratase subunit beta|uniref:SH3-like domain-containing protein n=1 Tax=Rhizobium sp. TaxID=391 RepID=UPI002AA6C724